MSESTWEQPPAAWLFVAPEHLQDRWRVRARPLVAVPLLPDEADRLLKEGETGPGIAEADEEFVALVAAGLSPDTLARRCSLSLRSVHRRLAALRDEFEVRSTTELVAELSARGFGGAGTKTSVDVTGDSAVMANEKDGNQEDR